MDQLTRRRFLSTAGLSTGAFAGCTAGYRETPDVISPSAARDADTDYAAAYEATIGSVAFVSAAGDERRSGSGFIHDGYLVTNQHVVGDAETADVRFHDGEWREAAVLASDVYADLAVLSVSMPEYADSLPFVESVPPIGTEVLVLGSPFGLESSVSRGIVSGTDRSIPGPSGFPIPNTVQTDAGLEPGNSGGPLVTLDGRVTGVAVAVVGRSVGFAVSPLLARRVLPELVETSSYEHSFLGIGILPVTPSIADANGLPQARGVYVVEVLEEGPAEQTLRGGDEEVTVDGKAVPVGGDTIVELAGEPVDSDDDLATVLALHLSPGNRAEAVVIRDGETVELTVPIGARPEP